MPYIFVISSHKYCDSEFQYCVIRCVIQKMVFILRVPSRSFGAILRDPGYQFDNTVKMIVRKIFESFVGGSSFMINLTLIVIMIVEGRTIFKSKWYVIVANLIVCTLLKSFVEVAFVIPYFIMQYRDGVRVHRVFGYFSNEYELFIFNLSVFSDHGVIFFSLLLALNRYVSITRLSYYRYDTFSSLGTFFACCFVWLTISIITVLFNSCNCLFEYNERQKMYYNNCQTETNEMRMVLRGLIHISYAVAIITLAVYARIFFVFRRLSVRQRRGSLTYSSSGSRMKSQLLGQSALIFAFYTITIFSIFALSFVYLYEFAIILTAENMLNLSIAIVYPICLICLPGELRSSVVARFKKKSSNQNISHLRVQSTVSMNNIPMYIMNPNIFH